MKSGYCYCTLVLWSFCSFLTFAEIEVPGHPPNILLITIDSLRADSIGAYGCPYPTTPFLDSLTKKSSIFSEAVSPSGWTSPSIISILTGLYPSAHGVTDSSHAVSPRILSLPKLLHRSGYHVPALSYLLAIPNYRNLGFEPDPIADDTAFPGMGLQRWSEQIPPEPFFAYYHFHGPHLPYSDSEKMISLFCSQLLTTLLATPRYQAIQRRAVILSDEFEWSGSDKPIITAMYLAKLREFDTILERLLRALADRNALRNTVIFLTSDHGELLLDENRIGHASTNLNSPIRDELIHVPLIILHPQPAVWRAIITAQVQTLDIFATVGDLVGIEPFPANQGRTLIPLLKGTSRQPTHEIAFASNSNCGHQCFDGALIRQYRAARTPQLFVMTEDDSDREPTIIFADKPAPAIGGEVFQPETTRLVRSLKRHKGESEKFARKLTSGAGAYRFAEPIPSSLQLYYRGIYHKVRGEFEPALTWLKAAKEKFHIEGYSLSIIEASDAHIEGIIQDMESADPKD